MRIVLERWLGQPGHDARLTQARETEWPDSCFGAGYPYESCAQTVTPGWELSFEIAGETYTFRTDPQAHRFRLMVAPPYDIGETIISWTGENGAEVGTCLTADIGVLATAFGDCGGQRIIGHFANQANRELLNLHVERFATFRAKTAAGTIIFTGKGTEKPTPADERAVAELAQLITLEARGGQPAGSWVNALALTQETTPDRKPACVIVDLTGRATVTDCQPNGAPQSLRLNSSGLDQLYRWVDELQPFEQKFTGKEVVTQIIFSGRGGRAASEADQEAIRTFADGLIADARGLGPQTGKLRYALPLLLPDGLDWVPALSSANDISFTARAEDPANAQWRWAQVRGSLEELARPTDKGTTVQLRDTEGTIWNFGEGHVVMWKEDATYFAVSGSFSQSEVLEIAKTLVPMQIEEFDQLMRERAAKPTPTK
jgi:hypothetical protein